MVANNTDIEKRLWGAADELRANSELKSSDFSIPVLGLIFLRYADQRFRLAEKELQETKPQSSRRQREISKVDFHAKGVMYLPEKARWENLIKLPEDTDIGKEINDVMRVIEAENEDLKDILPKTYTSLDNKVLFTLLKNFNSVPMDIEGDAFGKIYEYFLGNFAMSEGQKGGEFFTPTSLVRLIVEIIEPFHGKIYDPACGSGGMFVQSADFVARHQKNPGSELSIYGLERVAETVRLAKMNLAVHGLSGDIRQANSYYEDPHEGVGNFDFVMANPPFNVNNIDKERIKDDTARFPFGLPRVDNGNTVWMQLFYSSLNEKGRAGFVMANSASDARQSEQEIRRQLIEAGAVDVMVSIGSNFFYTVTLPCTLWFLDKGKRGGERENKVLFLDARKIFHVIDRAHHDFTKEQIGFISSLVRFYRGEGLNGYSFDPEDLDLTRPQVEQLEGMFANETYEDVPGLCKVVTREEIEAQGWSLNPGRYVGVADREEDDFDFFNRLQELNEALEILTVEGRDLEDEIRNNINIILNNR